MSAGGVCSAVNVAVEFGSATYRATFIYGVGGSGSEFHGCSTCALYADCRAIGVVKRYTFERDGGFAGVEQLQAADACAAHRVDVDHGTVCCSADMENVAREADALAGRVDGIDSCCNS